MIAIYIIWSNFQALWWSEQFWIWCCAFQVQNPSSLTTAGTKISQFSFTKALVAFISIWSSSGERIIQSNSRSSVDFSRIAQRLLLKLSNWIFGWRPMSRSCNCCWDFYGLVFLLECLFCNVKSCGKTFEVHWSEFVWVSSFATGSLILLFQFSIFFCGHGIVDELGLHVPKAENWNWSFTLTAFVWRQMSKIARWKVGQNRKIDGNQRLHQTVVR